MTPRGSGDDGLILGADKEVMMSGKETAMEKGKRPLKRKQGNVVDDVSALFKKNKKKLESHWCWKGESITLASHSWIDPSSYQWTRRISSKEGRKSLGNFDEDGGG